MDLSRTKEATLKFRLRQSNCGLKPHAGCGASPPDWQQKH